MHIIAFCATDNSTPRQLHPSSSTTHTPQLPDDFITEFLKSLEAEGRQECNTIEQCNLPDWFEV